MPPSIVLAVMKILEQEIDLREETRSVEQVRTAMKPDEFEIIASPLAETQNEIKKKTTEAVEMIKNLVDGDRKFAREIQLLTRVQDVMEEARSILARSYTGPPAIAAETEAIELLLQAKRVNPNGSESSGSSPGGGGGGTTEESALALLGDGSDEDAAIEDRNIGQATGVSGRKIPEEFRHGLDRLFNSLNDMKR